MFFHNFNRLRTLPYLKCSMYYCTSLLWLLQVDFLKFQLNVKNKIKNSKVSCTLYSVDCMQFVVSMFVLLMHLFKKCGVMINHSSINKNFRYTHFKNNLFDPLQTALVFTIMNFKERTYPDVAKIWICNINRIWWLAAISH